MTIAIKKQPFKILFNYFVKNRNFILNLYIISVRRKNHISIMRYKIKFEIAMKGCWLNKMTHVSNRDLMFQPFVLNDPNVIELLIEYRYKYDDNLFLGGQSVFDVTGVKAVNQEVVATYASLDMLIKSCNLNNTQRKMLKFIEQGYSHQEIGDTLGVDDGNVSKALKVIYKSLVKENNWQWRKYVYIDKIGLKTKQCSKCKEKLPATNEFYSDKFDKKDLLYSTCRKCR